MTDDIQNISAKWERLEKLASDHQRAARDCNELHEAWKRDCLEVARLYAQLYAMHSEQSTKNSAAAVMLRDKLEVILSKTIPQGAEMVTPYLEYVQDGGCFTYPEYLDSIKELEAEEQEASNPIDASEDASPF